MRHRFPERPFGDSRHTERALNVAERGSASWQTPSMSSSLASLDAARQSGFNATGSAWEELFDSTAMPVDSIGPSREEFREWLGRERGIAARALQHSQKSSSGNISAAQITLNQLRFSNLPRSLANRRV